MIVSIINNTVINQKIIQHFFSRNVDVDSLPKVPWHVRNHQLWLLLWYEPNAKLRENYIELSHLQLFRRYPNNFFKSLNGIFNGTISYRSDSFINTNFYSGGLQYVQSEQETSRNIGMDKIQKWFHFKEEVSKYFNNFIIASVIAFIYYILN